MTDYAGTSGRTHTSILEDSLSLHLTPGTPDFNMFIGSGAINLPTSAAGLSAVTGGGNQISSFKTYASTDLTVTYTYSSLMVMIPEPGCLGLMMISALFLGRTRKSAR